MQEKTFFKKGFLRRFLSLFLVAVLFYSSTMAYISSLATSEEKSLDEVVLELEAYDIEDLAEEDNNTESVDIDEKDESEKPALICEEIDAHLEFLKEQLEEAHEAVLTAQANARSSLAGILNNKQIYALVYLCDRYEVKDKPSHDANTLIRVFSGQTVEIRGIDFNDGEFWYLVEFSLLKPNINEEREITAADFIRYSGYIESSYLAYSDELLLEWEEEYLVAWLEAVVHYENSLFELELYLLEPEVIEEISDFIDEELEFLEDFESFFAAAAFADFAFEDVGLMSNVINLSADIEQFPESYRPALYALKAKYPNWTFVRMNTFHNWATSVNGQLSPAHRSLISSSVIPAWRAERYEGNWHIATRAAVEHIMDPRNNLTESRIFQFEQLTYNSSYHNLSSMHNILQSTFMRGAIPGDASNLTYAQAFMTLGSLNGISPYHLATRVRLEQGVNGTSPLISGTHPGFEGFFNYFNIGASGSTTQLVITNGLTRARDLGWNTRYKSLSGGSSFIGNNYIKRGQDTLYLQKFNVAPANNGAYHHQYMQNIQAPRSEANTIFNSYSTALNNAFVFKIPVFSAMPAQAVPVDPTSPPPPPPVNAQAPTVTAQPVSRAVIQGAAAGALSVSANSVDSGTLTYQWFSNSTNSNTGGTAISGATGSTFIPPANQVGTVFYYVRITNTIPNNGDGGTKTTTVFSSPAMVIVFTDTASPSFTFNYTKGTSGGIGVDLVLNGNTIRAIHNGNQVVNTSNYLLNNGRLTFNQAYLDSLPSNSTVVLTVSYNPLGVNFQGNGGPTNTVITINIEAAQQAALSITNVPALVTYLDTFTLGTSGGNGLGAVTYVSSDTNIATVNANTGAVTVVGIGDFTITATKAAHGIFDPISTNTTMTAVRKPITITGVSAVERDFVAGNKIVTLRGGTLNGIGTADSSRIGFNLGNGEMANADAGQGKQVTTNITLVGTAADRYVLVQPNITVNIGKASFMIGEQSLFIQPGDFNNKTINLAELVNIFNSEGNTLSYTVGQYLGADIITTGATVTNGILTFKIKGGNSGNTATIPVTIGNFANHKDVTIYIVVKLTNKIPATVTITSPILSFVYGSNPNELKATSANGENTFTFVYSGVLANGDIFSPSQIAPTLAGTYTVTVYLDSITHEGAATSPSFTILPKTISINNVSAINRPYNGTTNVALTGGNLVGVLVADSNDATKLGFTLGIGRIPTAVAGTKSVTTDIKLTGEARANYVLTQPDGITVEITPVTQVNNPNNSPKDPGNGNQNNTPGTDHVENEYQLHNNEQDPATEVLAPETEVTQGNSGGTNNNSQGSSNQNNVNVGTTSESGLGGGTTIISGEEDDMSDTDTEIASAGSVSENKDNPSGSVTPIFETETITVMENRRATGPPFIAQVPAIAALMAHDYFMQIILVGVLTVMGICGAAIVLRIKKNEEN